MRIYAAYGSNMNVNQMKYRCPRARLIGKGILSDYKLTFRGTSSGVANIEKCEGRRVPIVLWDITPSCEYSLDGYEGFPSLYIKTDVEIETEDGKVTAMAYVMTKKYESRPAEPSEYYFGIIAEGYEANGIPLDTLEDAYAESIEETGGGL